MECKIPDYAKIWKDHVLASPSPRMKDDAVEEQFWQEFIKTKVYCPDDSSRRVLQYLRPIFREYQVETALEFGPGWGNYTLDLAAMCRQVTCVDISRHVLDFVIRAGRKRGYENISGCYSKWEDFQPEGKQDLVFGYNCFYRQADLSTCFRKMNQAAEKLCVVGMNTGSLPGWVRELEAMGASAGWDFKDYIYFSGVLYQMGICANTRVLKFRKELLYESREAMAAGELQRCSVTGVDPEEAAPVIEKYFTRREDGSYLGYGDFHSGIVWW